MALDIAQVLQVLGVQKDWDVHVPGKVVFVFFQEPHNHVLHEGRGAAGLCFVMRQEHQVVLLMVLQQEPVCRPVHPPPESDHSRLGQELLLLLGQLHSGVGPEKLHGGASQVAQAKNAMTAHVLEKMPDLVHLQELPKVGPRLMMVSQGGPATRETWQARRRWNRECASRDSGELLLALQGPDLARQCVVVAQHTATAAQAEPKRVAHQLFELRLQLVFGQHAVEGIRRRHHELRQTLAYHGFISTELGIYQRFFANPHARRDVVRMSLELLIRNCQRALQHQIRGVRGFAN
mmetsp:Transcript_120240/g.236302  ORF Transcript_120240/g.236302 Transcript_120240/m.236302 type:complete len:292 (-) Transcript_120240:818-1693(-)